MLEVMIIDVDCRQRRSSIIAGRFNSPQNCQDFGLQQIEENIKDLKFKLFFVTYSNLVYFLTVEFSCASTKSDGQEIFFFKNPKFPDGEDTPSICLFGITVATSSICQIR
jgi:hypothetical protein